MDVVKVLLAAGADLTPGIKEDYTPLHTAAILDNMLVIAMLVEAGADVDAQISRGPYIGFTPAHSAVDLEHWGFY